MGYEKARRERPSGLGEGLHFDQLPVESALGQQLLMGALLYDAAFVDDHDLVGILNGGEPMGDDDGVCP